jgi:hypothetical protein
MYEFQLLLTKEEGAIIKDVLMSRLNYHGATPEESQVLTDAIEQLEFNDGKA